MQYRTKDTSPRYLEARRQERRRARYLGTKEQNFRVTTLVPDMFGTFRRVIVTVRGYTVADAIAEADILADEAEA